MKIINLAWLIPIIATLIFNGGYNMGSEENPKENKEQFYSDSLEIVDVFESCIMEKNKLSRSGINKVEAYLNKYSKLKSSAKEGIVEVYVDFLFAGRQFSNLHEKDAEQFLLYNSNHLKEIRKNIMDKK